MCDCRVVSSYFHFCTLYPVFSRLARCALKANRKRGSDKVNHVSLIFCVRTQIRGATSFLSQTKMRSNTNKCRGYANEIRENRANLEKVGSEYQGMLREEIICKRNMCGIYFCGLDPNSQKRIPQINQKISHQQKFVPQIKAILDLASAKISSTHISFANNFFP